MLPLPAMSWLVPVAILVTLIVTDRPCAACGRWFGHRLVCRDRPL